MERIPFFYSDLNVSKERRWGRVKHHNELLRYKKSISFSNVSSALLDADNLLDLKTNETLYQATVGEHLVLARNGNLLIQKDNQHFSMMTRFLPSSQEMGLESFVPISQMKTTVVAMTRSEKLTTLFFSSQDGFHNYVVVYNNNGKYLYGPSLALTSKDNDLVFMPENGILLATRKGQIIDIKSYKKLLSHKKIKADHLRPIAQDKQKILFLYEDENWGVRYPVLLKNDAVILLGFNQTKNVKLKSFDLKEEVFFLEHMVSEEYPKAYVTTLKQQHPKYTNVGNSFVQVQKSKNIFYFSTLTGSAWEQGRIAQFKKFETGIIDILKSSDPSSILSHFGETGFFSRAKDIYSRGNFYAFDATESTNQVVYPSFLRSREDLCDNTYAHHSRYVEQFDYQHGDYSCFGAVYSNEQKGETIFSIKYRTDNEILNNLDNYQNQNIEILGPNSLIWWSKNYNE